MAWNTTDLLTGLAEHLEAAGIVDWQPSGIYTAPYARPVAVHDQLPASIDQAVALACYQGPLSADGLSTVIAGVQLRWRGNRDPRTVKAPADAARDLLDGAGGIALGPVHIALIELRSSALLGQDESFRWERTDNYLITASRPTAWRAD